MIIKNDQIKFQAVTSIKIYITDDTGHPSLLSDLIPF